jgi:hypothetical protein
VEHVREDRLADTSVPIHPDLAARWSPRVFAPDAAIANLSVEAVSRALVAHPMAGFHPDSAREAFDVPAAVRPLAVVAVGTLGDYAVAPPDLVERDSRPRDRLELDEIAFAEQWGRPVQI